MQQYGEHSFPVWKAGELAPAGTYVRIDDYSYRFVTLNEDGPLPASFDGHVALYRMAAKLAMAARSRQQKAPAPERPA